MKLSLATLLLVCLSAAVCRAQEFSLQDEKGKTTGPYALKSGAEVAIGSNRAVIANVRTQKQQILDDLREIVIPEIEFKQTSLRDAVAFLQQAAAKADPKKRTLNLVLGLTAEQEQAFKATPITFTARNISVFEALRLITEIQGVKYSVRGNVVTLLQRDAPEDELVCRFYIVMPSVIERTTALAREACPDNENATNQVNYSSQCYDLKKMFGDLGVPWPAGSYIAYLSIIGKLKVCNTLENLRCFERILDDMGVTPRQIQIDLQFVAFDLTNINRLVASGPGINTASLTALWASGRGELVAAPTVVTKAGQEAVTKGVTEVIYPTTFTCLGAEQTNAPNPAVAGVASGAVEPGGFQTRETGMILQVVPEVSAEGQMINLTLNPQVVEDPVWENYGPAGRDASGKERAVQMRQPFFHVYSTSTSVSLANGRRILIGGGMPSRDGKRAVYLFARATLLDMSGEAIKTQRDKDEPDQPAR
ncbi:MAG: hypothetical protein WCR06_01465 [bacterium]